MTEFTIIQLNIMNAIMIIPIVMILTQFTKRSLNMNNLNVPFIAIIFSLTFSIFLVYRHDLFTGVIIGLFYGICAIGLLTIIKNIINYYRKDKNRYY